VTERHESGHSNSETGREVGMPESTVWYATKCEGEIKERGKFESALCGLQTSARNISVTR
jgi:hypothetical protein